MDFVQFFEDICQGYAGGYGGFFRTSLCGFRALFLKILVKGMPEAMAKISEIYALFLVFCLIAPCWLSLE